MLDLATHIVDTKSGHFDPSKFEDRYENALIELLKKQQAGEKVEARRETPPPRVVNLMELVHFGLLNPRGGLFGFRDLASARQISNLFAHGISLSEIIRSVKEVRAWLPEADLSNLRLHPAAHHGIEIEQPGGRTDKRGQFVLPVSPPFPNADALFEQAQAAEDAGEIAEAERRYRVLMTCDPTDAAPPFNLGNMLRANGRKVEAEAAFRSATRADPTFAEAWYNLSDLLDQQGRADAAIDCLRRALQAAPHYTDAIFNLALRCKFICPRPK